MANTLSQSQINISSPRVERSIDSPFLVGIDLGTTNCAVAAVDTRARRPRVTLFPIPQLTEPSVVASHALLPSFLYFCEPHEIESNMVALPWTQTSDVIAGVLARERGVLAPTRHVASAKSWLAHPGVDRRAAILPWGVTSSPRISPVDASARYLMHIRDAWNATIAVGDDRLRLEDQRIVLTVPASFDEEARELTVEAAREARFAHLTLLEEPIAAFYAWIAEHHTSRSSRTRRANSSGDRPLEDDRIALVCDVGGGTSDFSLIRVGSDAGAPTFERISIGDHLLLGGDNVDLALATLVERRLAESQPDVRLAITQRAALRRMCSAAKERLLGETPPDRIAMTILGTGRTVIGAAMTTELTREDVQQTLEEFLPITAPGEIAVVRDRRAGLRELGLPYETDPAITRHLSGFLARAAAATASATADPVGAAAGPTAGSTNTATVIATVAGRRMIRPDLVLFNGGFFTPKAARDRVVQALAAWFGHAPRVLTTTNLEAAVAVGSATYARLRAGIGPSMPLVKAGSGRAYYVGLRAQQGTEALPAVCVISRGTEEGTEIRLEHPFTVATNRPISFSLYSSTIRSDRAGDIVPLQNDDDSREHAPLVTVLRYGRKSRQVELPVRLSVRFTEVGTLELWCESQVSDHVWRLHFQVRGETDDEEDGELEQVASTRTNIDNAPSDARSEPRPFDDGAPHKPGLGRQLPPLTDVIVPHELVTAAEEMIRSAFATADSEITAETLVAQIEQTLGFGKTAWPLAVMRQFTDVLLDVADGRRTSASLEARWLNLFGFCFRPGFGAAKDLWRIGEARKIYAADLTFSRVIQNRVEWLVLWQRVAGGFSTGQQRELARRVMGQLGLGGKKAAWLNPQIERESWRLLATLERLDAATRARIGDELVRRICRHPGNASLLWAIGILGARAPLYGPLSSVVPPNDAGRWLDALLSIDVITPELASAIVQIAARVGDPLRDLDEERLACARTRLIDGGIGVDAVRPLEEVVATSTLDANRVFGEPLPDGLRLDVSPG